MGNGQLGKQIEKASSRDDLLHILSTHKIIKAYTHVDFHRKLGECLASQIGDLSRFETFITIERSLELDKNGKGISIGVHEFGWHIYTEYGIQRQAKGLRVSPYHSFDYDPISSTVRLPKSQMMAIRDIGCESPVQVAKELHIPLEVVTNSPVLKTVCTENAVKPVAVPIDIMVPRQETSALLCMDILDKVQYNAAKQALDRRAITIGAIAALAIDGPASNGINIGHVVDLQERPHVKENFYQTWK